MNGNNDNNITKAAALPAKKQNRRRVGKIVGIAVASFFIALLAAFSVNSIVSLSSGGAYKLTSGNSAFNALLSFTQSVAGLVIMLAGIALIVAVWLLSRHIFRLQEKRKYVIAALAKAQDALSRVNLRYDNINEITAVLDVLEMLTHFPKSKKEQAEIISRLNAFVKAENIALPQTPETAAILDSLPAPDTPSSLAAALSAGATLRQAEDGQTLVLTTISGGKNILLTPVQTADGVILCQQGARLKSDLAPNLEDIGFTSMPASPEFFEGLPLEKNVIYPELPEPHKFGPEMLSGGAVVPPPADNAGMLSAPTPTQKADYAELGTGVGGLLEPAEHVAAEIPPPVTENTPPAKETPPVTAETSTPSNETPREEDRSKANAAYAKLRGTDAATEIEEVKRLDALLSGAMPLSDAERLKVEEYKARRKKSVKAKKELSQAEIDAQAEKKQKAKAAAEKRKREHEEFLNSLSAEDRELYLAEQQLKKSRQAAIRKLKKLEADRKILKKIDGE